MAFTSRLQKTISEASRLDELTATLLRDSHRLRAEVDAHSGPLTAQRLATFESELPAIKPALDELRTFLAKFGESAAEADRLGRRTGHAILDSTAFNAAGTVAGLGVGAVYFAHLLGSPLHLLPAGLGWFYAKSIGHAVAYLSGIGIGGYSFGLVKSGLRRAADAMWPAAIQRRAAIRAEMKPALQPGLEIFERNAHRIEEVLSVNRETLQRIAVSLPASRNPDTVQTLMALSIAEQSLFAGAVETADLRLKASYLKRHASPPPLDSRLDGFRWGNDLVRRTAAWARSLFGGRAKPEERPEGHPDGATRQGIPFLKHLPGFLVGVTRGAERFLTDIVLKSSQNPPKMVLDFADSMLGVLRLAPQSGTNASFTTLVKVLVAEREWREGNLGEAAGEAIVNLLGAYLKTAAYMKLAEGGGGAHDPAALREELAHRQGLGAEVVSSSRKLGRTAKEVLLGPLRLTARYLEELATRFEHKVLPPAHRIFVPYLSRRHERAAQAIGREISELIAVDPALAKVHEKGPAALAVLALRRFTTAEDANHAPDSLAALERVLRLRELQRDLAERTLALDRIRYRQALVAIDPRLDRIPEVMRLPNFRSVLDYTARRFDRRPSAPREHAVVLGVCPDGNALLLDASGRLRISDIPDEQIPKHFPSPPHSPPA